jgi:hypothetical protein
MKATVHIVLNKRGVARMTKNKPDLSRDEIAVGLRLAVPDSAFLAPIVYVDLNVPDHAVLVPEIGIEIEEPASAIEARSDETEGLGPQGESAVPKADAQTPSPSSPSPSEN